MLLFKIRERDLPRLETNLQSKLNLPWSSRRGESALLRRSQNRRVVAVLRAAIREQEVSVVQDIEEFRAELQVCPFSHRNVLEDRHVTLSPPYGPNSEPSTYYDSLLLLSFRIVVKRVYKSGVSVRVPGNQQSMERIDVAG